MSDSLLTGTLRCGIFLSVLALGGELYAQNAARPGSSARTSASSTGARRSTTTGGGGTGTRSTSTGGRQYRSNTELGDATIQIDPETRTLLIVTDEETHRELEKVIVKLDRPKPQVLIKVVFLEVTYNKGSDIGLEGSYTFNVKNPVGATTGNTTTTTTEGGTTATGGTTNTVTTIARDLATAATLGQSGSIGSVFGAPTQGSFARVVTDDWSATLHMLATRGKVEVLSRPSIMARNNQEAVIVVGSEVPFITNSRTDALGNLTNTITYDNVGIILRVTPFITTEGTVEMIVAPEISSLSDQTVPISSTVSAPVISKRSAETVVVTPNGQTVVIGGLMETQRISSVQKIPILGDIPFLGLPFKRTIKSDQKRELLIFLTPFIVNDAESLWQSTTDEVNKTELLDKSFNQADFQKYLEAPPLPETDIRVKPGGPPTWNKPGATPAPKPVTTTTTTTKSATVVRPDVSDKNPVPPPAPPRRVQGH